MYNNLFLLTGNTAFLSRIEDIERMRISTIHNFARNIMENTSTVLGVGSNFSSKNSYNELKYILPYYLDEYTNLFLKKLQVHDNSEKINIPFYRWIKDLQNFIAECSKKSISIYDSYSEKAFGDPPEELKCVLTDSVLKALGNAQKEYENVFLRKNNSVNFDQRMENMRKCIGSNYFNPLLYPYKFLFVDEFQDTDDCQIKCFKALQNKVGFNFFIVGDLKQSIYYFRGASTAAFDEIEKNNKEWIDYSLNINYRTEKELLKQFEPVFDKIKAKIAYNKDSDQLVGIKNTGNVELFEVDCYPNKRVDKNGKEIYLGGGRYSWQYLLPKLNEKLESAIDDIDIRDVDKDERTIAILVRTNYQIEKIINNEKFKELINKKDVTLDVVFNDEVYKNEALKDIITLLGSLTHPYDAAYLFALLTQTNIIQIVNNHPLNYIQRTKKVTDKLIQDTIDGYLKKRIDMTWKQLLQKVQEENILTIIHNIYTKTRPWEACENMGRSLEYKDNFARLMEELEQKAGNATITLNSLYDKLLIEMRKKEKENSLQAERSGDSKIHIVCKTVHQAKGLQYNTVILPCTNDKPIKEFDTMFDKGGVDVKLYPDMKVGYKINGYKNSYWKDENNEFINESARILYVAMTRAMKRLIILRPDDKSVEKAKDYNNNYDDTWTDYLRKGGM